MQESKLPVLNEILYLANPSSPDFSERRKFIEIYRPDTSFSLKGCALENDSETFRIFFDNDVGSAQYFVIKHKATLSEESRLQKGKGILWLREFELNDKPTILSTTISDLC